MRILIVDDDAEVVAALIDYIETTSDGEIHCDYAHEVLKAQSLCQVRHYDLIITDFHMPFQNGLNFAKALRNQAGLNQLTHVLMISGFVEAIQEDTSTIERFTLMGKPIPFEKLEEIIESCKPAASARANDRSSKS